MYKFFSWSAVILWMTLIFSLSHQPAAQSGELSTGITRVIVENVQGIDSDTEFDIGNLDHVVRKNAHFFLYFVLGIIMMNALRRSGIHGYRSIALSLLICVLYAVSDEVHQLFVPGRGAQAQDVLIDSAGASVGVGVYLIISRIMKNRNTR